MLSAVVVSSVTEVLGGVIEELAQELLHTIFALLMLAVVTLVILPTGRLDKEEIAGDSHLNSIEQLLIHSAIYLDRCFS
jgi:hypothetical protein